MWTGIYKSPNNTETKMVCSCNPPDPFQNLLQPMHSYLSGKHHMQEHTDAFHTARSLHEIAHHPCTKHKPINMTHGLELQLAMIQHNSFNHETEHSWDKTLENIIFRPHNSICQHTLFPSLKALTPCCFFSRPIDDRSVKYCSSLQNNSIYIH